MYGYVYKTTDLSNGKIYVGQHKSEKFDPSYLGSGVIIKRLIERYGSENFSVDVVEECESEDDLNDREIFWIKKLDARNKNVGYNIATGGAFGNSGYHLGMLGKHQSDKQKEAVRNYMKNRVVSEESRKKMSKSKIGTDFGKGNSGKVHIFKGDTETKCLPEELDIYLSDGWKKGHKPYSKEISDKKKDRYKNSTYISKDGVVRLVLNTELDSFLNDGWVVGKIWKSKIVSN